MIISKTCGVEIINPNYSKGSYIPNEKRKLK
jgi:hypothetical protein